MQGQACTRGAPMLSRKEWTRIAVLFVVTWAAIGGLLFYIYLLGGGSI